MASEQNLPTRHDICRSLSVGWRLLIRREKARLAILSVALFCTGLLDMLGVASVMPLVGLILDPAAMQENAVFGGLVKWLISRGLADLEIVLATVVAGLLALGSVVKVGMEYWVARFTAQCASRLSQHIAQRIMHAPYPWFLKQNSAVLGRLTYADVGVWGGRFLKPVINLFGVVVSLVLGVVMIVLLAPFIGVGTFLIGGMLAIATLSFVRPRIQKLALIRRQVSDDVMLSMTQAVAGIKGVKLSSREDDFATVYGGYYRQLAFLDAPMAVLQKLSPETMVLSGQLLLIAVAVILWHLGASSAEIVSTMTLLVLVSSRLVPAINKLSSSLSSLWDAFPFIDGIRKLLADLDRVSSLAHSADTSTQSFEGQWKRLALDSVGFRYGSDEPEVLSSVSLGLDQGKAYGIAGPSGAGKSTLIDIILGLLQATAGELRVDGRALSDFSIKSWQRRIGYVPQSPFILHTTLRANVAFGVPRDEIDDARVTRCLRQANLGDLLESLDEGLDTVLGEHGVRLSGGQRQRVAIARSLYHEPDMLVLDEATSALDSRTEKEIQAAIEDLRGRMTTVTIAHRCSTLRTCDAIFVLEGGRLVAEGTYAQLMDSSPLFRQLAGEAQPPVEIGLKINDA
jgi:ABC-type multidrug transport system fused ATPase/permease subunit